MSIFPPHGPLPPGSTAVPAATVIVFRNCPGGGPPELLMLQRSMEMRFAGGAAVFPGGRVDPEDRALASRIAPDEDQEIASARIAAIRETLEEAGLVIAANQSVSAAEAADARALLLEKSALDPVLETFGWTLDLSQLTFFAHWCPAFKKAFDTRFFIADLGTGAVDVTVDATENMRLFWASAKRALELNDAGEIKTIFPTRRTLERLALCGSFEAACENALRFPARRITPVFEVREGEHWTRIPEGLGYPILEEKVDPTLHD